MTSSKFMAFFSKKLENFVFNNADLSTSVSKIEINKIKKLYKVKCINLKEWSVKKILKFKKKSSQFRLYYLLWIIQIST